MVIRRQSVGPVHNLVLGFFELNPTYIPGKEETSAAIGVLVEKLLNSMFDTVAQRERKKRGAGNEQDSGQ